MVIGNSVASAALLWKMASDSFDDLFGNLNGVFGEENLVAEGVDFLALLIHHIVIFKRVFAHGVIALLDPFLRCFNRFIEHFCGNRLSFWWTEAL